MSTTGQPQTFSELYTALMNSVRADTGQSTTVVQAKRYINTGLVDMHIGNGEKFRWAERQATLRTRPMYNTGTVTIAVGSTTLAGSGTAWNTNGTFTEPPVRVGGKLNLGDNNVYEVTAVSSDTSITLNVPFIGPTALSASEYAYYEDEYALASDFLRPQDWRSFTDDESIRIIGRTDFRRRYPRNNVPGTPRFATMVDKGPLGSTARRQRIIFYQPPSTTLLLPYSYVTANLAVDSSGTAQLELSADTDEPIVPVQFRHLIVLNALVAWYRDKKDDQRSLEAAAVYADRLAAVVGDNEVGAPRPRISPRMTPYRARAAQPWRGGRAGGRFTVGTRFDEFR